ncbi:hypothetical protein OAN61_00895 [bacterium]|nr:hypothetical protein [bacterium]
MCGQWRTQFPASIATRAEVRAERRRDTHVTEALETSARRGRRGQAGGQCGDNSGVVAAIRDKSAAAAVRK